MIIQHAPNNDFSFFGEFHTLGCIYSCMEVFSSEQFFFFFFNDTFLSTKFTKTFILKYTVHNVYKKLCVKQYYVIFYVFFFNKKFRAKKSFLCHFVF